MRLCPLGGLRHDSWDGVIGAITLMVAPATFETWAWRIPFWSSLVLVGFGLWLRRGVEETPRLSIEVPAADSQRAYQRGFSEHLRPLLTGIALGSVRRLYSRWWTVFTLTM